jgi:hypothetical protein
MGKTTENDIRSALESLSTGSGAYNRAYKDAIERITEQDVDRARLAKKKSCRESLAPTGF